MLLRTSSNPIAQTLLSASFPDGPKRELLISAAAAASSFGNTAASTATCRQISCPRLGSPKLVRKPIKSGLREFRRALSDSNLEALVSSSDPSCDTQNDQNTENQFAFHFQGFSELPPNRPMLETYPSLSTYKTGDGFGGYEVEEPSEKEGLKRESGVLAEVQGGLERTVTIGDKIEDILGGDFSFGKASMGSIVEEEGEGEVEEEEDKLEQFNPPLSPPMYLATGLGVDAIACDLIALNFKNLEDLEEYYKSMVEEFPSHPLLLRNYADLLKDKGDFHGAEEYYLRATLADPEDGGILSQYAKLVWELHADRERAEEYFKRAAQSAPQDSHVLAAYASFLWEVDENSEGGFKMQSRMQSDGEAEDYMGEEGNTFRFKEAHQRSVTLHREDGLSDGGNAGVGGGNGGSSVATGGPSGDASVEEYYKRRVKENPFNPLVLSNYAHFLYQSKGDLQGAEEYYARALLLDQSDGEVFSQYAKLVWELHGDKEKAQSYFRQAVKTTTGNSYILAAHAGFLWATGGADDDEDDEEDDIQVPCLQIPISQGILAQRA